MCGIAGIWPNTPGNFSPLIERMLQSIAHRGPDSSDALALGDRGPFFAHRRLAIVDLSPAGRQPMVSPGGRFTLILNGEIYNHQALRREVELAAAVAWDWRGHSDTETLLAAIETWGLRATLDRCTGMFALALWDRETRQLQLARDRFGEKPLYWSQTPKGLAFASELKALMVTGWLRAELSRNALASLMRHNNIPAPQSVFADVSKLPPGHILTLDAPGGAPRLSPYWSVESAWAKGRAEPFTGSETEAVDAVERELSRVLAAQMQADVPLGAFLSGGIDSSTVVALMQAQSSRKVKTFTIGFPVTGYNEAESAEAVARHLGTDHTELYLAPDDALRVIEKLPSMYCEPFADSSQIPTYLVSSMARQHVTVALSGDAGDEVFGGYNRYLFGPGMLHRIRAWPRPVRAMTSSGIEALPPAAWDRLGSRFGRWMHANARFADLGDKLGKVARALRADTADQLYESFISQWPSPQAVVPGSSEALTAPDWAALGLGDLSFVEQMMVRDALGYLPDDILTKVDRASMAVSLEARAPYLDHKLYELLARMPERYKVRDGQTKWLLRQILYKRVPRELIDRPKVGFGMPIDRWLRHELKDWAEALLSQTALERTGVFDVRAVRRAWSEHLQGAASHQHRLWCVLMFQAWHDRWIRSASAAGPTGVGAAP